jgi:hypothetical protein
MLLRSRRFVGVSKKLADDSDFRIWTDYCPQVDLSEPLPSPESQSKTPNRAFRSMKTQIMTGNSRQELSPTKQFTGITPFKYRNRESSFSSMSDGDASPLKYGRGTSPTKPTGLSPGKGGDTPSKRRTSMANFIKRKATMKKSINENSPSKQEGSEDHGKDSASFESPTKNNTPGAQTFENFSFYNLDKSSPFYKKFIAMKNKKKITKRKIKVENMDPTLKAEEDIIKAMLEIPKEYLKFDINFDQKYEP